MERLTGTGVWSAALRYGDPAATAAAAAELEQLGYRALWVPDIGGDVFGAVANLLAATTTTTVATGILNLWMHSPEETAGAHAGLTAEHGDRFLVGIGVSHQPLIDMKEAGRYRRPLAADGRLPRRPRRGDPAVGAHVEGPRRARAEDARAGPRPAPPGFTRTSSRRSTRRPLGRRSAPRRWWRRSRRSSSRPTPPPPASSPASTCRLPRPAELRQQLAATGLHRGRHRRRWQRPPGRRARRVGRRRHHRPAGPAAPRRRRRPRVRAGDRGRSPGPAARRVAGGGTRADVRARRYRRRP